MESSPIGVIFGVEPWNFSHYQLARIADIPNVGSGQIFVQTEACGVYHTDLHAARGDWPAGSCMAMCLHASCSISALQTILRPLPAP